MKHKRFSTILIATSMMMVACGGSGGDTPHTHDWGTPTYTWNDDFSSCTATRVCKLDSSHVESETKNSSERVVTPAGCTTSGSKEYKVTFTNSAFEEQIKTVTINPHGHSYGAPSYVWSEDNSSCTATRVCSYDSSHIETETKQSIESVITPAGCETSGSAKYSVTFSNPAFLAQEKTVTIDPLGHDWGNPTYSWSSDYSSCKAERVCTRDASHKESEEVRSSYEVITEPGEESEGLGRYTADFVNSAFETQTHDVTLSPTGPSIKSFEDAVNSIKTKHNYAVNIVNVIEYDHAEFINYNMYNLNDGALYSDIYGTYYSGYIKQKDQGIVRFTMPLDSSGILLGSFVCTNVERTISDYYNFNLDYVVAIEQIFKSSFIYSDEKESYICTDYNAMALIANLAFGDYAQLVSVPEKISAVFKNNDLIINAVYDVTFFDEEEINTKGDVVVTISNFEKVSNARLEEYIANPDYTYVAPTEWSADVKESFDERFNGYYPPFIEGLSFAYKSGIAASEGNYVTMLEDYWAGDLTTNYASTLLENGFSKVSNPGYEEYQKKVEDEQLVHTYSIKMKYYTPTDKDGSGMEYSYLFPHGVSFFMFVHKQTTKETITTVKLLNEYIASTEAGSFLPSFNLADDTKVKDFKDATDTQPTLAFLGKGTNSAYFYIYPDTKAHATTCVEEYVNYLKSKGFTGESSAFAQEYWLTDEHGSIVRITDPSYISTWSASSKLYVRLEISKETVEAAQEEIVYMDKLEISEQTLVFEYNSEFVFDGTVTLIYTDGSSEVVTPTEVIGPDTTQVGQQTVIVRYTNDEGETIGASYTVEIKADETLYDIIVTPQEGVTINISSHPSLKAKAGERVTFSVNVASGYKLNGLTAICNGESLSITGPNFMTGAYYFTMKSGDVTLTANVTSTTINHSISYVVWDDHYNQLNYSDVINSSSVLPLSAAENSTVNFTVVTNSGYTFVCASEKEDEGAKTTSSFSYQMGTKDLEINIVVSVDPVAPDAELSSIALSGQTTTYEVGDTFSFDGVVTATYSDGNSKEVTPTEVSSPDMSTIGDKTVTVSYTEDEITKTAEYTITVSQKEDPGEFGGTYSWYKGKMGGVDTYFRITFNEDGTGTYVRDPYNGSTATIYFSYVVKGDNITLTLTDIGSGFNCFSTYRPFDFDAVGTKNTTGVINSDGSISFALYNAAGSSGSASSSGTYTFSK